MAAAAAGPKPKRVAVIGAGCSGLAAIKCCLDEGVVPLCYEMSDDIGGLWNYTERAPSADGWTLHASVYESCSINTSKEMMAFSDFPVPVHFAPFMPHRQVLAYFRAYAERFRLRERVLFGVRAERVRPAAGHEASGRWTVECRRLATGERWSDDFDGVMVCSGHHRFPYAPRLRGLADQFGGLVLHSADYKQSAIFKNKRVLVVGMGNSAADIAVDASHVTDYVHVSSRRGSWVISRFFPGGLPADALANTRFMFNIPRSVLQWMVELMANFRYNADNYGLKALHKGLQAHPTIHDYILLRIMSGYVKIRPDVDHFTRSGVVFSDGTYEDIDVVVLATGFNYEFPFLDSSILYGGGSGGSGEQKRAIEAYKFTFLPHLPHPTLALIGLVQAIGAVMPISELQARWFARVITGRVRLPTVARMYEQIEERRRWARESLILSKRHDLLETYWVPAMDSIAVEIGVKPDMRRLLLEDPLFALRCYFGPCVPAQYRLHGPGKWDGARDVIERALTNVTKATQTRVVPRDDSPGKRQAAAAAAAAAAVVGGGAGASASSGCGGWSERLLSLRLLLYTLTFLFVAMMLADLRLI